MRRVERWKPEIDPIVYEDERLDRIAFEYVGDMGGDYAGIPLFRLVILPK